MNGLKITDESLKKHQEERQTAAALGFKLIKQFVTDYPNTEYPSVDDNLIETFCRGARLLGMYHMVLPEDDTFCPTCKYTTGKLKNCLSLHTMEGSGKDSTLCIYCSYEGTIQDLGMSLSFGDEEDHDWNIQKEHDYYNKAILKAEGWN